MNKVSIIATGEQLLGRGIRSIQSVLEEMLEGAEREITIAVYTLSGSLADFFQLLENSVAKGIRLSVIINKLSQHPPFVINSLQNLEKRFKNVRIIDFDRDSRESLHMKVIAVDRKKAVVGSANLTWSGMVRNHEMGVLLEGSIVEKICTLLDKLFR